MIAAGSINSGEITTTTNTDVTRVAPEEVIAWIDDPKDVSTLSMSLLKRLSMRPVFEKSNQIALHTRIE